MIKNQLISMNDLIVRCEDNIVSDMQGEMVMLSVKNGKYYNMGQMGGHIWNFLSAPMAPSELIASLMAEYDVEQTECEGQVMLFLEQLLEQDLIRLDSISK